MGISQDKLSSAKIFQEHFMTHPSPVDFDEVTRIQERAIAEAIQILEDHNEVLIEAPTGAGKTRINARILEEIAKRAGHDFNSLKLCHRERLATQSQAAFRQWVQIGRASRRGSGCQKG